MRHASSLAVALAAALSASPAIADTAPVGVLAPAPDRAFPIGEWLKDAGVATATSGAILGLTAYSGALGPVNAYGPAGAALFIALSATLPPAVMLRGTTAGFRIDDFLASLTGGMVGFGLGYLVGGALTATTQDPWVLPLRVGAMAVGQGLFTSGAYHLYEGYKPGATDLDKLPEHRTDDPILNWKLQRERRNP